MGRCLALGFAAAASLAGLIAAAQGPAPAPAAEKWQPSRTADGQPDIQGVWKQTTGQTTYSLEDGEGHRAEHISITGQPPAKGRAIVDPPDGKIPYQPWAAERRAFFFKQHLRPSQVDYIDPVTRCFLNGVPRINVQGPDGFRIVQTSAQVVILYEFAHTYRVIPLDGRPPVPDAIRLWMGDSRGRWEGDTLVVDVTNHNDRTWFDIVGSFHGPALHVVERWTPVGADVIDYKATITDPTVFTKPWTIGLTMSRVTAGVQEQWESAVCEGNRAVEVIMGLEP